MKTPESAKTYTEMRQRIIDAAESSRSRSAKARQVFFFFQELAQDKNLLDSIDRLTTDYDVTLAGVSIKNRGRETDYYCAVYDKYDNTIRFKHYENTYDHQKQVDNVDIRKIMNDSTYMTYIIEGSFAPFFNFFGGLEGIETAVSQRLQTLQKKK